MRFPFFNRTTLCACAVLLLSLPAMAEDPPVTQTNGLSGYVNLPTAMIAIDDKSPVATGIGNITVLLDSLIPRLKEINQKQSELHGLIEKPIPTEQDRQKIK